jgi:hypothetical protein
LKNQKKKKFYKPKSFNKLTSGNESNQISLLSKIFGSKKELDIARNNFFNKFNFESNINSLRFLTVLLLISIFLCSAMFFIERNNEKVYQSWKYQGIENIPPSDILNFDSIIDFSQKEELFSCDSKDPEKLLNGICDESFRYVDEMNSTQSLSQLIYIIQILLLFLLLFPLATFFHRSIRNIKTLRYETNISAEKSVIWIYFFVFLYFLSIFISRWISSNNLIVFTLILLPVLLLSFRILKVFKEIYLGSREENLSHKSIIVIFSNRFKIWMIAFVINCLFNPSIITRLWSYNSQNLNEFIYATKLMYFSSLSLIVLNVLTILLIVEIYKMQEIKNIKNGSIEINPIG